MAPLATSPATVVAPPAPTAWPMGLLRAAEILTPDNDEVAAHWPGGISWLPHSAWQAEVVDDCDKSTAQGKYPGLTVYFPQLTRQDYIPFTVEHGEQASTFGFGGYPYAERARAGCANKTAAAVEYELWTGELSQAKGYGNPYLAAAGAVDLTPADGPVTPRRALALLEQALANAGTAAPSGAQATVNVSTGRPMGPGRRGMIHCLPEMVPAWASNLLRQGAYLTTYLDTLVVPGAGYPGTGPGGTVPAAGTTWLYATPLVVVRLGDIYLPDATYLDHPDRSVNTVVVRAQRFAAAYWDSGPGLGPFAVCAELTGADF